MRALVLILIVVAATVLTASLRGAETGVAPVPEPGAAAPAEGPAVGSPAVAIADDFAAGLEGWEPLDASHWERRQDGERLAMVLTTPGTQRPPVRRPTEYILLRAGPWSDVTIEADIRSLRPARVVGRDVCILFGYQDETHFYYAHLCSESNGTSHNVIMKVDGAARRVITREKRPPARLTDGWHRARVTHRRDGEIAVYLDDLGTPLMTAHDAGYPVGRVGLGAFDDPAMFARARVSGVQGARPVAAPVPAP